MESHSALGEVELFELCCLFSDAVVEQNKMRSALSPTLFNAVMAQLSCLLEPFLHCTLYSNVICLWASSNSAEAIREQLQEGLVVVNNLQKDRGMNPCPFNSAVLSFTL